MSTGGAYDELTLWEQIDGGAQYTPAKKWLTSVPIGLYVEQRCVLAPGLQLLTGRFLISTHYSNYDYNLFAINFTALIVVLFPKLPIVSAMRPVDGEMASAGCKAARRLRKLRVRVSRMRASRGARARRPFRSRQLTRHRLRVSARRPLRPLANASCTASASTSSSKTRSPHQHRVLPLLAPRDRSKQPLTIVPD